MKKQVLFIHSAGPQGLHVGSTDLLRFLEHQLGDAYNVLSPAMPDPEEPSYREWKDVLTRNLAASDSGVILVGHSLGGSVLLKFLAEEKCPRPVLGLFILASPLWGSPDWNIDEYKLPPNAVSRLSFVDQVFFYHSIDDEVVSVIHLSYYARKFPHAVVRVVEGGRHLFSDGLPALVHDIRSIANPARTASL